MIIANNGYLNILFLFCFSIGAVQVGPGVSGPVGSQCSTRLPRAILHSGLSWPSFLFSPNQLVQSGCSYSTDLHPRPIRSQFSAVLSPHPIRFLDSQLS